MPLSKRTTSAQVSRFRYVLGLYFCKCKMTLPSGSNGIEKPDFVEVVSTGVFKATIPDGFDGPDYPLFVQLGPAPAFICRAQGVQLKCAHCQNVLVDGYEPRRLIAIDIQCYRCKSITRTPSWPDDESLPIPLLTFGRDGGCGITTIDMTDDGAVAITCDQEIDRVRSLTGAALRKPELDPFPLDTESLDSLVDQFDQLTGQSFTPAIASVQRAMKAGNHYFVQCPPAWAIVRLKDRMNAGEVGGVEDNHALGYLQLARYFFARWTHHPLFPIIGKSLCNEFNHAMTMLSIASHLLACAERLSALVAM